MCLSFAANADQLAYISQEDAAAAVKLISKQKYVLLYCGCCAGDEMQYVKIKNVSYRHTGYADYYEVVIEGIDANGNMISEPIDLAYAHIQKKKNAACIGKVLKIDCDPCIDQLAWNCPKF